MRSIVYLTLAVSTSCAFSFRKMSEVVIHKHFRVFNKPPIRISFDKNSSFEDLLEELIDDYDFFTCYVYDKISKQGIRLWLPNPKILSNGLKETYNINFNAINRTVFKREDWLNINNLDTYESTNIPKLSYIKRFHITDPNINSISDINSKIVKEDKKEGKLDNDFLNQFTDENYIWCKNYVLAPGITMNNTKNGVKLSNNKKEIDFQEAFKKYVAKDVNLNTSFTLEEKELLDHSEILAVWHLVPTTYTNEDYIKREGANIEGRYRTSESKTVNRTLIGSAVDNRDNTTFFWVTDLAEGDDIAVLLED